MKIGALGIEDGLRNVREDSGFAFGDVAVGEPEEDGVEDIVDAFGRVEVVRHFFQKIGEDHGTVLGKVVLAVGFHGGSGKIAAAAAVARDVRAALTQRWSGSERLLKIRER